MAVTFHAMNNRNISKPKTILSLNEALPILVNYFNLEYVLESVLQHGTFLAEACSALQFHTKRFTV